MESTYKSYLIFKTNNSNMFRRVDSDAWFRNESRNKFGFRKTPNEIITNRIT